MTDVEASCVAKGVVRLALRTPTLPPATHTNSFVVGTREALFIEPGSPYEDELGRATRWVEATQRAGLKLRAILLTHHHGDHAGGARELARRLGLPIWAHAATAQRLAGRVQVDRFLEHGECIELDGPEPVTVEAVHTPGHAPGHLCYLVREPNVLIAGDMIASIGTILVDPTDGDMQLYLRSLQVVDDLDTGMLLPAHGDPVVEPRRRLRFYMQHRLQREARVVAALTELSAARGVSVAELVPLAYFDTPQAAWPLAQLSTEAHLIKLVREGRAERTAFGYRSTT